LIRNGIRRPAYTIVISCHVTRTFKKVMVNLSFLAWLTGYKMSNLNNPILNSVIILAAFYFSKTELDLCLV